MSNLHIFSGWGSLAVILLGVSPVLAQIEQGSGIIRITDKAPANATQVNFSQASHVRPVSQCQSCQQQGGQVIGSYAQGECDYNGGNCPNCYGRGQWMMGGRMAGMIYGCTKSPGTGYIPPGKVPVRRQNIGYTQYYPSYWSGMGYGTQVPFNPAVAVPTDTTQLGYYYNHVPVWQAKPNMIPGIPNPDLWHVRRCGNNQQCQENCPVNHGMIVHEGNIKPVPEHINSPIHQEPVKEELPAPPAGMNPAKKELKAAEPMAYLPEGKPTTQTTALVSFPKFDDSDEENLELE